MYSGNDGLGVIGLATTADYLEVESKIHKALLDYETKVLAKAESGEALTSQEYSLLRSILVAINSRKSQEKLKHRSVPTSTSLYSAGSVRF